MSEKSVYFLNISPSNWHDCSSKQFQFQAIWTEIMWCIDWKQIAWQVHTFFFFFQSFLASYLVRTSGPSPTASVRCPLKKINKLIMVHHYPKIQKQRKILILNVCECVTCLRVTVSAVTLEGGTLGIYLFDENYKKDYICISPTTLNIFKDTISFIHKYDYIY